MLFFFFKQKPAYEMRMSDWSSDVCSSDLGAQTVINWTPDDTAPSGGPIDFLPTISNLEFYGTGDYTVLNRFIGPAAAARPVALNGTVSSHVDSPFVTGGNVQGGNIWFQKADGLLIGGTATIYVGILVLKRNPIQTRGGLQERKS